VTLEIVSATRTHGLLPDERRLVEAYGALPRVKRYAFLRQIEVASLPHRCAVPDRDSGFPAAPPNAEWSEFDDGGSCNG
jgi:hypothetical protein